MWSRGKVTWPRRSRRKTTIKFDPSIFEQNGYNTVPGSILFLPLFCNNLLLGLEVCTVLSFSMGTQISKDHQERSSGRHGKKHSQDDMLSKSTELTEDTYVSVWNQPSQQQQQQQQHQQQQVPSRQDSTLTSSTLQSGSAASGSNNATIYNPNEAWRRGNASLPSAPQTQPRAHHHTSHQRRGLPLHLHHHGNYPNHHHNQQHQHQGNETQFVSTPDPLQPKRSSRTIPMKCPRRKSSSVSTNVLLPNDQWDGGHDASTPDGEDTRYLSRMYDSRTWEMYRRITEARRNSQYSSYSQSQSLPLDQNHHHSNSMGRGSDENEWENLQHDYAEDTAANSGHEMIFLFDFD